RVIYLHEHQKRGSQSTFSVHDMYEQDTFPLHIHEGHKIQFQANPNSHYPWPEFLNSPSVIP
ncbi:putative diflavin flavoprotein A 2, partial [Clarias magur]